MTQREEDLINLTRKGAPVAQRVNFTLTDEKRVVRALARLIALLREKESLTEAEIDDLLLEAAGPRSY